MFMTDNLVGQGPNRQPAVQLWVAALPREKAVKAVMESVPSHYTAELTDDFINFELARRLDLKPGDVSELSSAR
ncbi:hypothetical protein [Aurantimonas sp. C2-3-R2]|uniref:hypothetical protein n=1 Tax=Aurantimonas sp. C2-3-R2 TaxID=3114363 RepID=UPI002E1780D0